MAVKSRLKAGKAKGAKYIKGIKHPSTKTPSYKGAKVPNRYTPVPGRKGTYHSRGAIGQPLTSSDSNYTKKGAKRTYKRLLDQHPDKTIKVKNAPVFMRRGKGKSSNGKDLINASVRKNPKISRRNQNAGMLRNAPIIGETRGAVRKSVTVDFNTAYKKNSHKNPSIKVKGHNTHLRKPVSTYDTARKAATVVSLATPGPLGPRTFKAGWAAGHQVSRAAGHFQSAVSSHSNPKRASKRRGK